jgi:hypothetical protein
VGTDLATSLKGTIVQFLSARSSLLLHKRSLSQDEPGEVRLNGSILIVSDPSLLTLLNNEVDVGF